MSKPEESIFSEELQTLLDYDQHPMARQFRDCVVKALKIQSEEGGDSRYVSFALGRLLEVAGELDMLLNVVKSLAEVVAKQTATLDSQKPPPLPRSKERLS